MGVEHASPPSTRPPAAAPEAAGAAQWPVEEKRWPWKWGSSIRYFEAGPATGPALLLLHGFGVGAWHFEKNMGALAADGYHVWAVDLLGQGSSWPEHPQPEAPGPPLVYSIDTWTGQMRDFVDQVVRSPVYAAGNSLGGMIAVALAAQHPGVVRGLVLLNSTPFWGFLDRSQGLWARIGLSGVVPVPEGLKTVIRALWWDKLRARPTIVSMLSLVTAHKPAVAADAALVDRIIEATDHPGALDAFCSIVLAPKTTHDFDTMLRLLECPVTLVCGQQDPWVVPLWGQRAVYTLSRAGRPPAMYLELVGAGHCPHHEAPTACNVAISAGLRYMQQLQQWREQGPVQQGQPGQQGQQHEAGGALTPMPQPPLAVGERWLVQEEDARTVEVVAVAGRPRLLIEKVMHALWHSLDGPPPRALEA